MVIEIGYTPDEIEKVDKDFTIVESVNAQIKDDTAIVNPTFIIKSFNGVKNINYIHASTFGRYYFVKEISAMTGDRIALQCKCDVLMSFKNAIRNCTAIIDKQENTNLSSKYIDDGSYVTECRDIVQSINFPSGFTSTANIIITAGG